MTNRQRDLSLLLLGAALVKPERANTLALIRCQSLHPDVEPLVLALRNRDQQPIRTWLAERGVTVDGDAVAAAAAALDDEQRIRSVKKMLTELEFAPKLENRTELLSRLKECIEALEATK